MRVFRTNSEADNGNDNDKDDDVDDDDEDACMFCMLLCSSMTM